MDKKIAIGVGAGIIILIILIGSIFFFFKKEPSYQNPSSLEELKKAKASGGSEFDKCLKEVEASEKIRQDCIFEKLKAKGYEDGIDCIQNFDNPLCKSTGRYNAEVDASNRCWDEYPSELGLLDCLNLAGK